MKNAVAARYDKGGSQKDIYSASDVTWRNCPLCGKNNSSTIYKERAKLGIVRCKHCTLIYVNPIVKDSDKNYWGNEENYRKEAQLLFDGVAKHHRDPNYLEDLKLIERIKPEGEFLDIGTNMGFFLRHTSGRKWNTVGVEPSPTLSKIARRDFGLNVKTAYLHEAGFNDNSFDVVTMTDVFEHISDPKAILADVKRVIKKDGILFIKVPNGNYNLLKLKLAKATNRLTEHDIFDSYEHITHYTQKTLVGMLKSCGFTVNKVLVGRPVQLPVWHKYVGHFYQYPSPWILDARNHILRTLFYWISRFEYLLSFGRVGYFAPNITMIASPINEK